MPRAVPALLMVLLIGNPICCCAVDAPQAEAAPTCCQEQAAHGVPAPPEDPRPVCPCARNTGVVVADKMLVPSPTAPLPLPDLAPSAEGALSPHLFAAPSLASLRTEPPPGSGPPVPLHVLYGVFRC